MNNFSRWYFEGDFTATGTVFDCGCTTLSVIVNYSKKVPPEICDPVEKISNGNVSLMRILPVVVYSRMFTEDFANLEENEIKSSGYVVETLEAVL